MRVFIVPFKVVSKVLREFKDTPTNKYEHDFKDLEELAEWIWEHKHNNFDVLFFSLYGQLAVTTYRRNMKGALLDEGHRYEYCGNCKAIRTFHLSPLKEYAVCDVCHHEKEGFRLEI